MSLILEALRKSEAERRRGDAPGLRVELPPTAPPARRRRALPAWIAGGVLLALLAAAALWPDAGRDRDGARDPAAEAATLLAAGTAPADAVDAPPATTNARSDDAGRFPDVERIRPPAAVDPGPPVREPAPDLPLAPPPMATRAAEEAAEAAEAAMPVIDPPPASPPAARGAGDASPTARDAAGIAATPAPTPATTATRPAAGDAQAVRLAGLPPAQRRRLPAMRLTMHMWNQEPARRFAIIDGQRKVEGDRLGAAVIVAIDREGVLLDLEGQAVRVPLP